MTEEAKNIPAKTDIALEIERLLAYALHRGLIEEPDAVPVRNALLDLLKAAEPCNGPLREPAPESPEPILERMLDYAAENGLIPENNSIYRDLFDTRIMGLVTPRASEVVRKFRQLAESESVRAATDYFYSLSKAVNYIRADRIMRNLVWRTDTEYGRLEITVNLSKPEFDPREIALLRNAPAADYPKCPLCVENAGYAGRVNHPARQNLRLIPLDLDGERWYFQFSPYLYYNEHSIVLSERHEPMKISEATFRRLLDFIGQFPHYFIGSNADLPIVGGSILSHDHFQAGRHTFPMERAPVEAVFTHGEIAGVRAGIVAWPLSVIRLRSRERGPLLAAANHILHCWRDYADPARGILPCTETGGGKIPHNTVTPIARFSAAGEYELDIVLRNNRTSAERPDGIFHPRPELHHIKKENIGLIEVMGLAVLPGRLERELAAIKRMLSGKDRPDDAALRDPAHPLHKHAAWIADLIGRCGTNMSETAAEDFIKREIGRKFLEVLADCGVFKRTAHGAEGFRAFMLRAGFRPAAGAG